LGVLLANCLLTSLEMSRHFCVSHHSSTATGRKRSVAPVVLKKICRDAAPSVVGKQRVVFLADLRAEKRCSIWLSWIKKCMPWCYHSVVRDASPAV